MILRTLFSHIITWVFDHVDSAFALSQLLQNGSTPKRRIGQFVEKNFSKIETRPKPEKSIE